MWLLCDNIRVSQYQMRSQPSQPFPTSNGHWSILIVITLSGQRHTSFKVKAVIIDHDQMLELIEIRRQINPNSRLQLV